MTITIYKTQDCQMEKCDGEYVFYNQAKGQIAVLNQSAGVLWSLMNEIEDYDKLLHKYYNAFIDIPALDVFAKDYDRILAYFLCIGLVRVEKDNKFIEMADVLKT